MPIAIKSSEDYNNHYVGFRKNSGYVKVPQLFFGNKPIIYRYANMDGPALASTKWCCFCADPTKGLTQHNIDDYALGGSANTLRVLAGLMNLKKTDNGSGLTVAVKGIRNNSGTIYSNTWTEASLRITRTSITTNYLNVFTWAAHAGNCTQVADQFAWWTNDAESVNVQGRGIYPYKETFINPGTVDGVRCNLVQRCGTIKKASSGTYLYVCSPGGLIGGSNAPNLMGWGMILEPTNSNPYPV